MVFGVLIVVAVIGFLAYLTVSKKENVDIIENNEQNMNTQQTEGVKITILKEGTGDVAKAGDTVAMNYTGQFLDGRSFDSNVDPKFGHVEPFVFVLGAGQVIKGWDVGVAGMKVGEKRSLVIEPAYAYGESGAGGVIPPNATLSFEVELLAIKK